MIVTCISATTELNKDTPGTKIPFNIYNLSQISSQINKLRNIPIIFGFPPNNPIGYVTYSTITNNTLGILCNIEKEVPTCFIVPIFKVRKAEYCLDNNIIIIKDLEIISMGITSSPVDRGVTRLKEVKW